MVPDRTRIFLIILDGVGAGYATDASLYGDVGSHTLGHIAEKVGGMELPYLQQCGLGNLVDLQEFRKSRILSLLMVACHPEAQEKIPYPGTGRFAVYALSIHFQHIPKDSRKR